MCFTFCSDGGSSNISSSPASLLSSSSKTAVLPDPTRSPSGFQSTMPMPGGNPTRPFQRPTRTPPGFYSTMPMPSGTAAAHSLRRPFRSLQSPMPGDILTQSMPGGAAASQAERNQRSAQHIARTLLQSGADSAGMLDRALAFKRQPQVRECRACLSSSGCSKILLKEGWDKATFCT